MSPHPEAAQLSAYLDGELAERELIPLDAHLSGCEACRSTLAALRATIGDLGLLHDAEPGEDLAWSIRTAIARERKRSGPARKRLYALTGAAAAAAAVVAGLVLAGGGNARRPSIATALTAASPGNTTVLELHGDFDQASLQTALGGLVLERTIALHAAPRAEHVGSGADAATTADGKAAYAGPNGQASTPQSGNAEAPQAAPPPPAPKSVPAAFVVAPDPLQAQAQRCDKTLRTSSRTANVLLILAARYNGEEVFVFFYESPAANPSRIELWVVARSGCQVRYFRQQRVPPQ